LLIPKASIYYWRTTTAKEVDFIIEQGRKLVAFEVKSSKEPTFSDIKNLLTFIEENPHTIRGVFLYAGRSIKWLHSKVLAVPWWWITR
jgi:predicted AAA+ superfamily ATPase